MGLCVAGVCTIGGYIYYAKIRSANPANIPAAGVTGSATEEPSSAPASGTAPEPPPAGDDTAANSPSVGSAPIVTPPEESARHAVKTQPAAYAPHRIFYRHNGVDSHYGKVAYVDAKALRTPHFVDQLSCEVVYVAGPQGICLGAKRGVVTTYSARLFDTTTFETHSQFPLNGVPSRSRVSRDGKLAAFTVFVSGHGYTALDFSTQTLLVDTATGAPIADLETFTVLRDGKPFKEADFNFWGVTFTPDARDFFATLSTGGKHFLLRGNIESRTATILHENVECPSLSPDGTRVAYKKRFRVDSRVVWELHVLDLATGKETPLKEKRSVDDQLEWLDADNVLYSVPETGQRLLCQHQRVGRRRGWQDGAEAVPEEGVFARRGALASVSGSGGNELARPPFQGDRASSFISMPLRRDRRVADRRDLRRRERAVIDAHFVDHSLEELTGRVAADPERRRAAGNRARRRSACSPECH